MRSTAVMNKQLPSPHYISCFIIVELWTSFQVLICVLPVGKLSFWCVCNKFLLITTSVIHWFYFFFSELLTTLRMQFSKMDCREEMARHMVWKQKEGGVQHMSKELMIFLSQMHHVDLSWSLFEQNDDKKVFSEKY